jgi:hypothetical protein
MKMFVRAVVTGFAFTLGATLFRKVAKKLGIDDATGTGKAAVGADANAPLASEEPRAT